MCGSICVCVCLPEQPDAETDRDVVERVKAHHAHQQILKDDLRRRNRNRQVYIQQLVIFLSFDSSEKMKLQP